MTERLLTKDGFETTIAANHYGHFLMTNLLLDDLEKTEGSRVAVVASAFHSIPKSFDVHKLNRESYVLPNILPIVVEATVKCANEAPSSIRLQRI